MAYAGQDVISAGGNAGLEAGFARALKMRARLTHSRRRAARKSQVKLFEAGGGPMLEAEGAQT